MLRSDPNGLRWRLCIARGWGFLLPVFPPHVLRRLDVHLQFHPVFLQARFLDDRPEHLRLLVLRKPTVRPRQDAERLNQVNDATIFPVGLDLLLDGDARLRKSLEYFTCMGALQTGRRSNPVAM